jgi:hypothetical protein
MHTAPPRLTRLDRILSLSQPPVARAAADTDPQQVHLASVPLERIQALTVELQERSAAETDEVDAVTMRLLLNDYKVAVGHLRAVANNVDARLRSAAQEIHDKRKAVRREEEMAMKRAAQGDRDA